MAVDVLSYNALNCRTQALSDTMLLAKRTCFFNNPDNTSLWTNDILPMCITSGTVLNVCDTSGLYRCGVCCLWTVPAGVTRAQFQLWGAGGGSGSGQCCTSGFPGQTGAYAIVTIPVTAGWTYTLCSGCAACCYAISTSPVDGCASFVVGCGLNNFCAEGGRGSHCAIPCLYGVSRTQLQNMGTYASIPTSYVYNTCNGMNYCGTGGYFCSQGSGITVCIPSLRSDRTFYGNTSTSGVNVCGIPSMITSGFYRDNNFYGYNIVPPVPTPCCATTHVTDSCYISSNWCCFVTASGTSCGGHCCSTIQATYTKYFLWPGQGGVGTSTFSGVTDRCGDAGRMGMVKVTYC